GDLTGQHAAGVAVFPQDARLGNYNYRLHQISPICGLSESTRDETESAPRRDRQASQVKPTRHASRSRHLRASANVRPADAGSPKDGKAAAAPPSSAPMRAGIHPAAIFTMRLAASIPRILPACSGRLRK